MQSAKTIWLNGQLIPWDDAQIHLLSHSLHYGSGAFEGIRFYKTEKGPAIFRLEDHVDRLLYSAKTLKMDLTYSKSEIIEAIIKLTQSNEFEEGYIRPILYYGYGKMGVNPLHCPLEFAIASWVWGAYLPLNSVDIKTSSLIRIHPASTTIDAKLTGHYINGVLASLELRGTHYHEALFLDSEGFISEGVGENFFIVKNNILYTPKLGTILAGITRQTIIKLASTLNIPIIETNLTLSEAYDADEAFFTGTAAEITPIRSIDDKSLKLGSIGPLTEIIQKAYGDIVRGKNALFSSYLTYVQKETQNLELLVN